jgi:hypothetical protein
MKDKNMVLVDIGVRVKARVGSFGANTHTHTQRCVVRENATGSCRHAHTGQHITLQHKILTSTWHMGPAELESRALRATDS